jgi:catechol 2,3-dioxygenase-like lactoylglutathione lyase family enzyme
MAAIRYMVQDVDAAVAFYTEQLGFTLVERWGPAFANINRDGVNLWLSGPQTSAARPMSDGSQPVPGGWNRIVVQVVDIEELAEQLKAAGTTFRNDIISGPGGKQVLVEDPSGNPIELFEEAA